MEFSWDLDKNEQNKKKHKVSFEEASSVFYDPLAKLTSDPDHSHEEDRLILIGHSQKKSTSFCGIRL
jgi:uncharacterized DUF497 family protein